MRRGGGRRCIALRVAIFLAVIAGMLRPTYVFTEMKRHRATVIVLADRSRSMSVADEFKGLTRWKRLTDEVEKALPAFRDLTEDLDVKFYTFDADIGPVDLADKNFTLGNKADGAQTAIGAALDDALRKEIGHRLAGVILLSDGAQNALEPRDAAPQAAAKRLSEMGVPLFTIVFGQEGSASQRRDVAVSSLDVNPTIFVKNELIIVGSVRVSGYKNQDIPVQALYEVEPGKPLQVIGTQIVRATKDGEELPVRFSYIPQTIGEHKVVLRVEPQEKEQDTTNNEQSTIVKVFEGGLNVLYVEGTPRVDQHFLTSSLKASPDIRVEFEFIDQLRIHKTGKPADMSDKFKPGKFDVFILGDIDSECFRKEDLEGLKLAVERGSGLIMLGGFHSFWAGGYQDTPLRDVLPLEATDLSKFDRQGFDDPIREKLHIFPSDREKGLKMLPSPRFGDVPLMQLGPPDKNREIWDKLPGLDGANRFERLKPTAQTLAVTPAGQPLLVAIESGSGRVLAFAGDSTWHWVMQGFRASIRNSGGKPSFGSRGRMKSRKRACGSSWHSGNSPCGDRLISPSGRPRRRARRSAMRRSRPSRCCPMAAAVPCTWLVKATKPRAALKRRCCPAITQFRSRPAAAARRSAKRRGGSSFTIKTSKWKTPPRGRA